MPPMSNVVVKIPVTRRPINYSRFPHPVYIYIYIYGSRLKLPVASPSCRFPIHKIDTLQLIPRILGRVSYLPHPVKGNDIFADCCGILSWLRMEIMGRGGIRWNARPRRSVGSEIITVSPRHAYAERISIDARADSFHAFFSCLRYRKRLAIARVSAFLRGPIRHRNIAYLRDKRLELNECLLSREKERGRERERSDLKE